MINLELPWNPAVLEQRIGRIYRLGQKLPIDVYNLVCEQGIESRIADLVGSKQAFFKGLFDGDSDSVQFESSGSFLSRVEKIYDPATLAAATVSGGTRRDRAGRARRRRPRRRGRRPVRRAPRGRRRVERPGGSCRPEASSSPLPSPPIAPAQPERPPRPPRPRSPSGGKPHCRPPARSVSCSPSSRFAAGRAATSSSRRLPRPPPP